MGRQRPGSGGKGSGKSNGRHLPGTGTHLNAAQSAPEGWTVASGAMSLSRTWARCGCGMSPFRGGPDLGPPGKPGYPLPGIRDVQR